MVYGKYKWKTPQTIEVTGLSGKKDYKVELPIQKPRLENQALKYLWARKKIQLLGDYKNLRATDEIVEQITQLGLKYSLLTDYTSFVAIDNTQEPADEAKAENKKISSGAVPEPHEWLLILLLVLGGGMYLWKLYQARYVA